MKVPTNRNEAKRTLRAIGKRIRMIRKARGLTSYDMAKALGISQAHVSRMESGVQGPRCVVLLRAAKILKVSPVLFFADDEEACKAIKAVAAELARAYKSAGRTKRRPLQA